MIRGLVVGTVTSTICHPSLRGQKLLLVQPLSADGQPQGAPSVAIDFLGAGAGVEVLVTTDGRAAQGLLDDAKSPVRNSIVALVDAAEVTEEAEAKPKASAKRAASPSGTSAKSTAPKKSARPTQGGQP